MNDLAGSDRPKAKSLKPLRALWPFIRRYGTVLSAAIAALLVASAAMLAMPVRRGARARGDHHPRGAGQWQAARDAHRAARHHAG